MSLRQQFLTDGCLHLPAALDPTTLEAALACWRWSMDHPGPASARLYRDALVRVDDPAQARALESDEPGFFYQDLSNPQAFPVYERLLRSEAIRHVLRDELELDEAWFIGEQVFLKEGATPPTGWHQDISDISARGDDLVVLWIPFDPVDGATSLGLVRGSHRGPVYSSIYGAYRAEAIPDVDAYPEGADVVSFPCEPGDVVVFHMGCLHGAAPTRPAQTRRALALRFVGPDAFFQSRSAANDPRNDAPYRNSRMQRIL